VVDYRQLDLHYLLQPFLLKFFPLFLCIVGAEVNGLFDEEVEEELNFSELLDGF